MLTEISQTDSLEIQSDILKEYLNFKNENQDYIVMFQIGAFFETFFEDAKIFSEVTGAQYTSRTFKSKIVVAESGVNKKSLNVFLKKLLSEDFKICVCSEFVDEYGKHFREVTRKYTPGTILEDEFLESSENNYLMAIKFSNDKYEIAYADVSTGQLYKTKTNVREFSEEINKISPKEIIISKNQEKLFKNIFSKYNFTLLDNKYFLENIEFAIDEYCKLTQKKYKTKLDKIIEYTPDSRMMLDEVTRKNLELTRTNYLSKKRGSLLWFLNYTKTPMGIRLLKQFLSAPLLSDFEISKRLDAVSELVQNEKLLDKIQAILSQFCDLSRLCSKISNTTILPKDLVNLSRNTVLLKELFEITKKFNSELFKINSEKMEKVLKLINTIDKAIKKDCSNEVTSGGIINDGYSAELDYLRNELNEYEKQLNDYANSQKRKLKIESFRFCYLSSIGYYFEIPSNYAINMPFSFYKKNSTNKFTRYTSDKLNEFQENINSKKYEITKLEYDIYKQVRVLACDFVQTIRFLANDIALIDVLAAYAKSAVINHLVKPEISGSDVIVKDGYHPSLIKLNNEIVKNDTDLKQGHMFVLTGANMAGKSTYLKQNAIICILAQIGSFVPAGSAKLPIVDKIFFRQNSTDDIINNNSSFMVEMNDLKYILDNATNSSLILLDEPAKSTNAKESGAIARAYCKYLLDKYSIKIIVATHNFELTKLEKDYPQRVTNYVIGSENLDNGLNRKIKKGVIDIDYALDTAILADLPQEILSYAKDLI